MLCRFSTEDRDLVARATIRSPNFQWTLTNIYGLSPTLDLPSNEKNALELGGDTFLSRSLSIILDRSYPEVSLSVQKSITSVLSRNSTMNELMLQKKIVHARRPPNSKYYANAFESSLGHYRRETSFMTAFEWVERTFRELLDALVSLETE
ncbi:hypothetical protein H0H81_007071 [Sphagnurus paluster]|uniref:RNase III domain-containing protein n=1 Tax=Sphagnurus paluster TaxID=117069 RepID=A0A9P7GRJ8_9AGAR|nr:hypothetical protein H0H81_007071 [Sphagnurus paluster]